MERIDHRGWGQLPIMWILLASSCEVLLAVLPQVILRKVWII